jgi:hypothetical protein
MKLHDPIETKIVLSAREYTDRELAHAHALDKLRWKNWRREFKIFKHYAEDRWTALNGEAGRLKVILDTSVASERFNAYVSTQQEKQEAAEKASRAFFDAYVTTTRSEFRAYTESQARAFQTYSEDISKRLAALNIRIATWSGALAVLVIVVQLWIRYK